MDYNLIQKALNNEENINIINTSIQEIKAKKNDILQQLGLNKEDLKSFHTRLDDYRYIEDIKDLRYGGNIRWINLKTKEKINLNACAHLCDIRLLHNGISITVKTYNKKFFTLYLNETLIFQKLNDEEKIILEAIKHLSKK